MTRLISVEHFASKSAFLPAPTANNLPGLDLSRFLFSKFSALLSKTTTSLYVIIYLQGYPRYF
jgi:hypothetical protein